MTPNPPHRPRRTATERVGCCSEAGVILHPGGSNRVKMNPWPLPLKMLLRPQFRLWTLSLSNIFPILKRGGVLKPCCFTRCRNTSAVKLSYQAGQECANTEHYSRLTPRITHKTIALDGLGYGEHILVLELARDNWLFSSGLENGKALIIY